MSDSKHTHYPPSVETAPPGEWLDGQYDTAPQTFCKPDEPEVDAERESMEVVEDGI
jgi:hypothetical protein